MASPASDGRRRAPLGKKNCWICKKIKDATAENFSTNPSKFDGLGSECRSCGNATTKRKRLARRKTFIESQGSCCASCGIDHSDEAFFDIDHIVPLFKTNTPRNQFNFQDTSNLQILCPNCHRLKTLKDRGFR